MTRKLQTEQEHQQRAFDLYYAQGPKRSHDRIAGELGVSVATVKSWSRAFDWSRRVSEKDAEQTRRIADRVLSDHSDINNRNLKIVRAALLQTAKDISQGRVKPQMGDLERLMRFEEYLTSQRRTESELPELTDPDALVERGLRLVRVVLEQHSKGREKVQAMLDEWDRGNASGPD